MVETGMAADQVSADRMRQVTCMVVEHEKPLLRYAARMLRDATAAEDVVQNVFIKLCRHWTDGVQPAVPLKAWLYRVTHNEAIDHLRRQGRMRLVEGERAEIAVTTVADSRPVPGGEDERRALVLQHLQRLHPRERQVVLLRLEEGLSYEEISRITGRSSGNVGNILHHAVRKLARSLNQAGVRSAAEGIHHDL
ncbi:MAG: sigma-70 family RNA polymerase sigma factor [Lentisphaerae bacterium]|nr:sigma-70 family RNA polymerase sigma factor [Lentisphaerota bacterium]